MDVILSEPYYSHFCSLPYILHLLLQESLKDDCPEKLFLYGKASLEMSTCITGKWTSYLQFPSNAPFDSKSSWLEPCLAIVECEKAVAAAHEAAFEFIQEEQPDIEKKMFNV